MQLFKPRQEAFNMPHEERWPGIGIAIMFMFIGIAIFIGIIFSIANGSFGFGSFGSVWNLLWLFFVIWFISWIFFRPWRYGYMHRHGYRHWHQDEEDAIEILKRRYAKGEITEAQFRKMMAELRKHEHG
jgi:putative membrane protein